MAKKGKGKGAKRKATLDELDDGEAARAKLMLQLNAEQKRSADFEVEVRTLREANIELKARLKKQETDQKDIHEYLTKSLDENYKSAEELKDELEQLQRSSRDMEKSLRNELRESRESHAKDLRRLEHDVMERDMKLTELNTFAREKEAIEANVETLRDDLQKERAARVRDCRELERRNVREKERLKKEMLIKIKETKQNLLAKTEEQLDATTKRTIMENEHIVTELHYQSKESDRVSKTNDAMRSEIARLTRECELSDTKIQEVTKRMRKYERLSKSLEERLAAAQSPAVQEGRSDSENGDSSKSDEKAASSHGAAVDRLRSRIEELEDALREVCSELASVSAKRRVKMKKRGRKFGSAPQDSRQDRSASKRAATYLCSLMNELRARTSAEELPMVLSSRFTELLKLIERRMCAHPGLRVEIDAARTLQERPCRRPRCTT